LKKYDHASTGTLFAPLSRFAGEGSKATAILCFAVRDFAFFRFYATMMRCADFILLAGARVVPSWLGMKSHNKCS
jgi:hypothetical protein